MSDFLSRRVICRRCRFIFTIDVPAQADGEEGEGLCFEAQCPSCDIWACFTVADTPECQPSRPSREELEEARRRQELPEQLLTPIRENRAHPAVARFDRIGNGMSGRRLSSWSSKGCKSRQKVSGSTASGSGISVTCLSRLSCQDEERRLESVLGIVVIAENPATNAEDHWSMPSHESFKGRFVLSADKGVQQLSIRQARPIRQKHDPAILVENRVRGAADREMVPRAPVEQSLFQGCVRGSGPQRSICIRKKCVAQLMHGSKFRIRCSHRRVAVPSSLPSTRGKYARRSSSIRPWFCAVGGTILASAIIPSSPMR
jgi:hypothetical protein